MLKKLSKSGKLDKEEGQTFLVTCMLHLPVLNVFVFDAFTGVNTVGDIEMNKFCW